jgi:hypothetical protein
MADSKRLSGRPCSVKQAHSAGFQPSRAAAKLNAETPGRITISSRAMCRPSVIPIP